ncbi:MAG: hypothetical protein ABF274_08530 [Nonlabens sp.]|uniref:hypothetical protein n=1 Tax=Nonlabens sp. TaxID=1888209 RepID=UPI00321B85B1
MNLKENAEIKRSLKNLEKGMMEYMEPGETAYTGTDVTKCMTLMHNFLDKMSKSDFNEDDSKKVKDIVLSLNELNEKCDHELIETDQREQLADIIILAGYLKGNNGRNEDITEEWRDW